jgi:hypothetical protein
MAGAGLAAGVAAQEPVTGFYYGATLSAAHDSNVTRQNAGAQGSAIDSAAFIGGFDRTYDRQHVVASIDVGRVLYRQFSLYDYTNQSLRLDLKSGWPGAIDTDFSVTRDVLLAHQADLSSVRRNVIAQNAANGTLRFPLAAEWRGVVSVNGTQFRNSNAIDRPADLNTAEEDAGLRYQTGSENYVDLLARSQHSTYPQGALTAFNNSAYRDRGADLRTKWHFAGASTLSGRIGYDQRRHDNDQLKALDFSAATYDLTYVWQVTYKASLTAYVLRTAGVAGDTEFLSAITHTYRITPAYRPTAHTSVEAHYERSRLNYYGDLFAIQAGVPPPVARNDNDSNFGLAGVWTMYRWLTWTLEAHREQRASNVAIWTYSDRVASIAVQAKF